MDVTGKPTASAAPSTAGQIELVPRMKHQGYVRSDVDRRRAWLEAKTSIQLPHIGACTIPTEEMRGNIENPIGSAQIPLGVAGPLLIHGTQARGMFYVPLATTEGALVRSYERGMVALTRAGGVSVQIYVDENRLSPTFLLPDIGRAHNFVQFLRSHLDAIRAEAESTTRHGTLIRVDCHPVGRQVIVDFCYHTADAQGMNMIVKATDHACRWILQHSEAERFYIFSGAASEKRASGSLFAGGKGKTVIAGAQLPASTVTAYLHVTPGQLVEMWRHTMIGHVQANALGYNGHYANGLTALFIACGQDVANVTNAAVGMTHFELLDDGDLYASVTLPALTVATVGGGTALGTAQECLELLGCVGNGQAPKLAEIVAATLLAGELSMGAAIASGEFVQAHETYGRNRPSDGQ